MLHFALLEITDKQLFYAVDHVIALSVLMKHLRAFIHCFLKQNRAFDHNRPYLYLKCPVFVSGIADRDPVQAIIYSIFQ